MAQIQALMAFGCPPLQAQAIVGDVSASLTAAGTTQANALKLANVINNVGVTAASTGVQLPSMQVGDSVVVGNLGANALLVYPVVGGAIQGGATNAGFSVATLKTAVFTCVSSAGGCLAILSA